MPLLYVAGDGTALVDFTSDRFRLSDLFDADGSAIVVHANPDNYANTPTDRYGPNPDATTLATGDAGGRLACGVVTRVTRCRLTVAPDRLRAGERATLTVRVHDPRLAQPLPRVRVAVRGAGIARTLTTTSGGTARATVTPRRAGRLRLDVARGLSTLGCTATRPVVARARAGPRPVLTG